MDGTVQPAPAGRRIHYERRRPEETALYQLVQEHLEPFLAQIEAETGAGLPEFVQEEFDAFLECGILAHGFLRLRCADCAQEKLVACEASIPGWAGNVPVAPTPCGVLLQEARVLPRLRRPAHGGDGRLPGRLRHSPGAGAAVSE